MYFSGSMNGQNGIGLECKIHKWARCFEFYYVVIICLSYIKKIKKMSLIGISKDESGNNSTKD